MPVLTILSGTEGVKSDAVVAVTVIVCDSGVPSTGVRSVS